MELVAKNKRQRLKFQRNHPCEYDCIGDGAKEVRGVIMKAFRKYMLAVKYWLQGDEWHQAVTYAEVIVGRWYHGKP